MTLRLCRSLEREMRRLLLRCFHLHQKGEQFSSFFSGRGKLPACCHMSAACPESLRQESGYKGLDMEGQGLMSSHFPPGFRFHPTDEELIMQYLWKKATASLPSEWAIITDIDLYKFNPWELPEKALFGQGEWFFFSPRDRKYPNGVRPNRAAASGYWKATGTDKPILATGGTQCIGVKKALVFYKGRPPKGTKTEWVMQEYRLLDSMAPSPVQKQKGSMRLDDWVLCRVRQKDNSGAGSEDIPIDSSLADARTEGKQRTHRERSSSCEWTEHLGFLLEPSGEQGREGSADDSGHGGFMWSSNNLESLCYAQPQQLPPQPQQSNKSLQCSADGWLAQTDSASVDQGCFPGYSIH